MMIYFGMSFISLAEAGAMTETLSTCFSEKANKKDKEYLAQWMFMSMAYHPSIKKLSNIDESSRIEINKNIAETVTRLLTEDCKLETKIAIETDKDLLSNAFGFFGILAMQEIYSNPQVNESIADFSKNMDKQKLRKLLEK